MPKIAVAVGMWKDVRLFNDKEEAEGTPTSDLQDLKGSYEEDRAKLFAVVPDGAIDKTMSWEVQGEQEKLLSQEGGTALAQVTRQMGEITILEGFLDLARQATATLI